MTQNGDQFEQDHLKDALRRAFPAEQAPQDLRKRVAAMLHSDEVWASDDDAARPVSLTQPAGRISPSPSPSASSSSAYTHPAAIASLGNFFHGARRVALAACFAGLAMGVAVFIATQHSPSLPSLPDQTQIADAGQVQPFVQAAMVRHDELLQAPDPTQMAGGSLGSLSQVRTEVQKRTAAPMPEADISPEGWRLVGAKSCQASNCCVAQIFYRRGQQTLSVFFIPPDAQGRRIRVGSSTRRDHLVAAREAGQFTVCVVGYSPDGRLTAQEVDRVADLIATH